jgi:hypothetical protein
MFFNFFLCVILKFQKKFNFFKFTRVNRVTQDLATWVNPGSDNYESPRAQTQVQRKWQLLRQKPTLKMPSNPSIKELPKLRFDFPIHISFWLYVWFFMCPPSILRCCRVYRDFLDVDYVCPSVSIYKVIVFSFVFLITGFEKNWRWAL